MAAKSTRAKDRRKKSGLTREVQDQSIRRFFNVVDGEVFVELCAATTDERFRNLGVGIATKYRGWGTLRLCKELGINLHELNEFYRDAMLHIATINIMGKVPEVMQAVVEESLPGADVCPMCDGLKMLAGENGARRRRCPKCDGEGHIVTPGSNDARKLLWEQLGLVKRGPLVAQQFNLGGGQTPLPDLTQVIQVRDKLLEDGGGG